MKRTGLYSTLTLAIAVTAVPAQAEPIFGLTGSNTVVTFDSATPGTITSTMTITGIAMNDVLTGIDRRPLNGKLYSVGTSGNVYELNSSGAGLVATTIGITSPSPSGASFGIDFNPMVDRLRFVSDTDQNLRINPNSPFATFDDTAITLNGSNNIDLVAAAYRNSFANAPSTVLYGLDAISDMLVRSTNANAGTYVNTNVMGIAFGPLGFTFTNADRVAFDISGLGNQGYFTINDNFYQVDQLSGAGTFVGRLGALGITGITAATAVPEPATWAMMIGGFGLVGAAMRRRRSQTSLVII